MDISKDNSYLSTGSKNGYVNVYSVDDIRNCPIGTEDVEPLKSFDNLTTSCDNVKFNKSSTVLGMSSKWKQNALRLVNLQTMQVYQNFPGFKARMKYPTCLDFNCDDSYLSIGNDEGKALFEKIEDEYDIIIAEEAYKDYEKSGCKSRPASELWKELGI